MTIRLLDCTLRDGGYVNEWAFGAQTIEQVVDNLTNAGIDFIEMGFIKAVPYDENKSLFRYVSDFKKFIPKDHKSSKYYGMLTFGNYELADIPVHDGSSIDGLRVIFKKKQKDEALKYCRAVKKKGYELFINPTFTDQYSDHELLDLIDEVNSIHPTGLSIVDSMGVMSSEHLVRIFMLIDHNLKKDIKVCFHSHNNLQQSFMNAVALINLHSDRELIVDVSVMGMGRGAGNLNAELMISYLNENYGTRYDLLPILKIIDDHISKIYTRTPWGYSMPYFLAASVKCHPNYAHYLINKQTISIEVINDILLRIPDDKKATYDEELIKQLYIDYQENAVDDTAVISDLKAKMGSKPVLIVGPGRTIATHKAEINDFIATKKPFVISLNFRPETPKADIVFISNAKRFSEQKNLSRVVVTSNIKSKLPTLNYASYLNNSEMYDNSALMLLCVLMKCGIKEVWTAGMDGFKKDKVNYVHPDMILNAKISEFDQRNAIMAKMLERFSKKITVHFLTPSEYHK